MKLSLSKNVLDFRHPSYHPNPAELDKYLNEIIFCHKSTKIISKVLKILYTFFEMIPKQWDTYDKKCKQVNEGCRILIF